jgi:DHA1 family multidrug resistance protein-like MFS transporter
VLGFAFVLPFLPLYLKQLHVESESAIVIWSGVLLASTAVTLAIFSPIWGAVADRRGRKLMVLRAMLLGALVVALMGFVENVWQLLALRALQGAAAGTVAASTALVASSVPRDRLAHSMGLLQTSMYLGISVGPLLGGVLAEAFGIRATFLIAGMMLATGGVMVGLFVHEHFPPPSAQSRPRFVTLVRAGLTSRALRPLLVVTLLIQLASAIVLPSLPLFVEHLTEPGHPVKLYAGLAFGATAVFSAIAALNYSRIIDRAGYRRLLIFACFGAAIFFAPQAFVSNVGQLLLLRAGLGIFFGVLIPATNVLVGLVTPGEMRGSAYGLTASATAMGSAVGPLLGSAIAASFGIPSIFLATGLVLALLGLWVIAAVNEPASA